MTGHMSPEEFRRRGYETIDWIARYLERLEEFPVMSRVEPGEIESALAAHEGVAQSVVTLWGDTPGDQRLTAYYVPADGTGALTGTVLRKHLRQTLPDYMVPQFFMEVDRLPLTPSGKVDRRNLPSPFGQGRRGPIRHRAVRRLVHVDSD